MRIPITLIGVIPLATIIAILPCNGELPPPSSYAVPPREGPSPSYGPPTSGSNSRPPFGGSPSGPPASNYGPPPAGGKPGGKPPAGGQPPPGGSPDSGSEFAEPEPFSFSYEVKDAATGNDFSHKQESDGKTVRGEYKVLLPDGRNQIVTYTADDGGYNADVKYDGEAQPGPSGPSGGAPAPGPPPAPGSKPSGGFGGYPANPPPAPGGGGAGYPSGGPAGYPSGPPSGGSSGYPRGGPAGGSPPASSYLPPGPGGGY